MVRSRRAARHIAADRRAILTVVADADSDRGGRGLSTAHIALGMAIRERREAAEISQEGLAGRCGLHRTYVGGIERGERNVSFANLLRLAAALDMRMSELLLEAERLEVARARGQDAAGP